MKSFTRLVDRVAERRHDLTFTVEYWDGTRRTYGSGSDDFVVRLHDRRRCLRMLRNPSLGFGEAYSDGALEVEGDLTKLMQLLLRVQSEDILGGRVARFANAVAFWVLRNSLFRSRRNVAYHYDRGNEFFSLWLGATMAYSCAYFRTPTDDLDTAQQQKFRHICEKLRLEAGQRVLDVGCGWGGFAAYAATHYGVDVVGITLSKAQKRWADEMLRARRLGNRVEIRFQDYREVTADRPFDRIVSIGMFEHVGRRLIPDYLRKTAEMLAPQGIGLLHTIGRVVPAPMDAWIATRVFPGAYFPTLAEIIAPLGASGLHTVDVESLRLHYAMTLDRWTDAFEHSAATIASMYDGRFVRMWRLYLRASAAAFRVGNLTVWQIVFTNGPNDELPLTRDYLYGDTVPMVAPECSSPGR